MYTENSALLNAQTRISPHPVLSSPQPQPQPQQPQPQTQPEKLEKPAIPLAVKRQMAPPPRQRRSSFRISNASPQQQQPQQPPLNPESHHVRTTNQKQKSTGKKPQHQQQQQQWDEEDSDEQRRPVEFAVLERRLIESIEIEESLKLCVNGRIADAISLGLLRVPILAFMITHSDGCQFVTDFRLLCRRYEVELLGLPESLSTKNLSVDMFHYEKEFNRIVSLLVYLTDLRPAKKFVISRQPIAITPHALEIWPDDETAGTQSPQQQQQTTMTITTTTTTTMTAMRHSNNNNNNNNSSNIMTMSRSNTGDVTIPNQTPLSAFERFCLNCMRMRQTGHYYMIYVDLGLTLYDQSVQRGSSSSTVSCKNGNGNR